MQQLLHCIYVLNVNVLRLMKHVKGDKYFNVYSCFKNASTVPSTFLSAHRSSIVQDKTPHLFPTQVWGGSNIIYYCIIMSWEYYKAP